MNWKKKMFTFILLLIAGLPKGFSQTPERIVSLATSITEMLYNLESGDKLVGCTSYCQIPKNERVSIVASAVDVNVEKVLTLKPDLVIATSLTKNTTIEAIEKLGIKVMVFRTPKSFDEICNQFKEIANLLSKQDLAKNIIDKQQERLHLLKQKTPKNIKPKVFFEIGAKPLFTVIPNTFMNDYITFAGGVNIASDLKSGMISRETVLARNPDVIFIVTMGIVGPEEKNIWKNYTSLNASKADKIFIIDSYKACSPNPIHFVDVTEQLISLMY